MTACPCAQLMVREHSLHELEAAASVPPMRTRARCAAGRDAQPARPRLGPDRHRRRVRDHLRAEDLVEIVENSMSSETYDLLKRPDELFIVNKATRIRSSSRTSCGYPRALARCVRRFPRRHVHQRHASELRVDPQARCVRRGLRPVRRIPARIARRRACRCEDRHRDLARNAAVPVLS